MFVLKPDWRKLLLHTHFYGLVGFWTELLGQGLHTKDSLDPWAKESLLHKQILFELKKEFAGQEMHFKLAPLLIGINPCLQMH